jgi:hypothetical protein
MYSVSIQERRYEFLSFRFGAVSKELFGWQLFMDLSIMNESNPICEIFRKMHQMRDNDNCHPPRFVSTS